MSNKTIIKEKNKIINNSPNYSNSSSMFEDINFSALFNPHDKYIHCGEKTSYDLLSYDLGIFYSLSNICKNLNISYDKIYSNYNSPIQLKEKIVNINNENINENLNENILNSSNNKDNIFTDSILKILLSENDSNTKKTSERKNTNKKFNESGISLTENELDELLKDYSPMEIEKKI